MNGPVCTGWPRLEQLEDPKGLASKARPSTVCGLEAQKEDALDISTGDPCTRSSEPALLFLHVEGWVEQ